ncbi:hypothetical protein [Gilliamella sp. Pas-s25]|uniref:hypothetical protein n=1 Tax=Gilliamella sp. Pas-s25 TaxID=2687310 RepID=UPI00135E49D1|nr:hypothetical protein [Gilliamella sp. Pas-s25]MWP61398.1 hypothetical protein [Gilliamella sp. Pas-s25]
MEQNKQEKDLETLQREFYNREAQKDLKAQQRKQQTITGAMIGAGALFCSVMSFFMPNGINIFFAIVGVAVGIFAIIKGGANSKAGSMMCGLSIVIGGISVLINMFLNSLN